MSVPGHPALWRGNSRILRKPFSLSNPVGKAHGERPRGPRSRSGQPSRRLPPPGRHIAQPRRRVSRAPQPRTPNRRSDQVGVGGPPSTMACSRKAIDGSKTGATAVSQSLTWRVTSVRPGSSAVAAIGASPQALGLGAKQCATRRKIRHPRCPACPRCQCNEGGHRGAGGWRIASPNGDDRRVISECPLGAIAVRTLTLCHWPLIGQIGHGSGVEGLHLRRNALDLVEWRVSTQSGH